MLKRMCPPPAPRSRGGHERQVHGVGHEVRVEQEPALFAPVGEVVRLAVEAVIEVVPRVEHEVEVTEGVDDDRRIGHGDEACGVLAGAVEVLVPGVQRNRKERARLPFEGDLLPGVVPHGRGPASVEHVDHLLEQLTLRSELLARRDLADVAVVRRARRIMVQEHAAPAAPRPGLELDGVQVRHVKRADDLQPFRTHPPRVRGFLLGGELLRQIFGDDCVLGHVLLYPWSGPAKAGPYDDAALRPPVGAGFSRPTLICSPAGAGSSRSAPPSARRLDRTPARPRAARGHSGRTP